MRAIGDFEDMLALLERHKVQYLIIGGVAFITALSAGVVQIYMKETLSKEQRT